MNDHPAPATGAPPVVADCGGGSSQRPAAHLVELLEAQAARTPTATALVCGKRTLTFAELDAKANALAWTLIARGIGPEDSVAVLLDSSFELIIAIVAALKSGAAYLPLDPTAPARRLAYMLEDASPRAILTRPLDRARLSQAQLYSCIDVTDDAVAHAPCDRDRVRPLHAFHPAYLIYTSGSTGVPKAVVISHHAVCHSLHARRRFYSGANGSDWQGRVRGSDAAYCLTAPVTFDISVAQIFGALSEGAALILSLTLADLATLDAPWRARVRQLMLPSSAYANLLSAQNRALDGMPLHRVIVGGDALGKQLVQLHEEQAHGVELVNEYGPTEATIFSTAARVCTADEVPPIGRPVANTHAHVLDDSLQPCTIGSVGELYIGGAGVARGYWRRAGLTAARFIASPFTSGERLYRTGDRAAWRPDGQLVFHGRVDEQLKVHGLRVEPAEIEAALLTVERIAQAAVVAHENGAGEKQIVAYIAAPAEIDPAAVREELRTKIPDYMLPSSYVVLPQLPLTANGKLDRRALPAPPVGTAGQALAPVTPDEVLLCEMVARLLKRPQVSLADDFFHLGGHSLIAARLIAEVRERLGRELPLRAVFEAPRLKELAERLRSAPRAGTPLRPQVRPAHLPLSFAQRRLWFLNRLEPASPAYNIPIAARLRGRLDPKALDAALADLIARHETLRTLFTECAGEPAQRILAHPSLTLEIHDSTAAQLPAALAALSSRGFALSGELPLRAHLLRSSAEEHVLLLIVHHSAADGGSVAPLLEDLAHAYRARLGGSAPVFAPLPVQYADYALWQRELLGEESDPHSLIRQQILHWRDRLRDLPVEISLPTDHPRPLSATCRAGSLPLAIPVALLTALKARTQEAGATLFMGLEAALAALLSRLGAGSDIPVGTVVAARPEASLDRLVGFFVNTLVLRNDLSGDPTFATLLERTLGLCLTAYTHQELPFERLVEILDPPRALGRQPLFQSMLVLNPEQPVHFHAPGLTPEPLTLSAAAAKFDLCFTFTEGGGELQGVLEYNAELFDADTAQALSARFLSLLEQLCAEPQRPLSRLNILLPEERARLTPQAKPTATAPTTLVALFEAQAARSPQATALLDESESCSYATLERRANQLAWHLIDCGIAPEDIVALCFERSFEMLIALLATLKAGAAYLPLDPQLPAQRLRFMLEDAKPRLVLSTRALAAHLPQEALCLEDLAPLLAAQPLTAPDNCWRNAPLLPTNPAYLIYTSGSSGTPKAVVIQHQSVAHYVELVGRDILGADTASMPLFTAAGFDLTLTTLFTPLCFGGAVHIVPEMSPEAALRTIFAADAGLTAVKLTPSHISVLASLAPTRSPIRVAIVGGEAL